MPKCQRKAITNVRDRTPKSAFAKDKILSVQDKYEDDVRTKYSEAKTLELLNNDDTRICGKSSMEKRGLRHGRKHHMKDSSVHKKMLIN